MIKINRRKQLKNFSCITIIDDNKIKISLLDKQSTISFKTLKELNKKLNLLNFSLFRNKKRQALAKKYNLPIRIIKTYYKGYPKIIDRLINFEDAIFLAQKEQEETNIIKKDLNDINKILNALYSINKKAKEYRDSQIKQAERIFDGNFSYYNNPLFHSQLQKTKNKKEELYNLKEKCIQKLLDIGYLQVKGSHKICSKTFIYLEDKNQKYSFHVPYLPTVEAKDIPCLGEIEEKIESKRERSMPPSKALKLIKLYIKDYEPKRLTVSEIYNKYFI